MTSWYSSSSSAILFKHLQCAMDTLHQNVHFLSGIIQRERCPRCGRHAKALHDRHGTMMAGTHRHSFLIEDRTEIMGMNLVEYKRDDTGLFLSRPNHSQPGNFRQRRRRINEQIV